MRLAVFLLTACASLLFGGPMKDESNCLPKLTKVGRTHRLSDNKALKEAGLVDLADLDDSIVVDIPYATKNNFAKQQVYTANRAYLHQAIAEKLVRVNNRLKKMGLRLKILDAYRPFSVQEIFWKLVPDEKFVAKPVRDGKKLVSGSKHTRGAAVDVTLVRADGTELEMPSAFDDFSEKAFRDYKGASPTALINRQILEDAMHAEGFTGLPTEWWHFDSDGWESFPLLDIPVEE